MIDILHYWRRTTKLKKTASGWWSGNAPCCIHNGETQDKRGRGGLIEDGNGGFSYHCFNCNYKAKFVVGSSISVNARRLMEWMGVNSSVIDKMSLDSIKKRNILKSIIQEKKHKNFKFKEFNIPNARLITNNDKKYVEYLNSRNLDINSYTYYITPSAKGRNKNRIIIPYKHNNKIVGWTSRFLDRRKPKYLNEHQQEGYIFGVDFIKKEWLYAIVAEGIFDAISLECLAVMHNEFTNEQLEYLQELPKEIIVVPDQDKAGLILAQKALEAGFSVSIPNWHPDIKDINDAVMYYGKIGTLYSILQAKESNKIKILFEINKLKRRINGI